MYAVFWQPTNFAPLILNKHYENVKWKIDEEPQAYCNYFTNIT